MKGIKALAALIGATSVGFMALALSPALADASIDQQPDQAVVAE